MPYYVGDPGWGWFKKVGRAIAKVAKPLDAVAQIGAGFIPGGQAIYSLASKTGGLLDQAIAKRVPAYKQVVEGFAGAFPGGGRPSPEEEEEDFEEEEEEEDEDEE